MDFEHVELSDRVYSRVKEMIFTGQLKPGQKLIQEKLSADLGISRTPLLKALQRLESELLVESIPRRGMYVKKIDLQDIIDVFECRVVIEGLAAKLAAQQATDEQIKALEAIFKPYHHQESIDADAYESSDRDFHSMILKMSSNKVVQRLEMLGNIHFIAYQVGLVRPPELTLKDHTRIFNAIKNREPEQAEQAMKDHLLASLELLKKVG